MAMHSLQWRAHVNFSFRNAQLAKQHAPAAKLEATAKPGEKMRGTLRGSGAAKPAGKEKSSGESLTTKNQPTNFVGVDRKS